MSTIEQAAQRLEQLRKAGIEVNVGAKDEASPAAGSARDPLPVRMMQELDAQASTAAGVGARRDSPPPSTSVPLDGLDTEAPDSERTPGAAMLRRAAGPAADSQEPSVTIDLARLSANGYITPHAPRSRLAEEFRVIKRPLLNNARGKSAAPVQNANRIMVTSAMPGEGKTFVSVNLAMSLAMEVDTRVLLVDADASRPAVLERLGLQHSKGLLDLLVDPRLPLESVLLSTNIDRLTILPAGTPQGQATELLASEGMNRLVERLASGGPNAFVIFDTPPLLAASESRVLAAHMGQVIMVIAADETPQGTVAEALATVENCPVVVTLLNRVSPTDSGHYYGSYGANAH